MRKTHFRISHVQGNFEVKIISLFKHNGRLWVIHYVNNDTDLQFRCSDYLTGMCIDNTDSYYLKKTKELAKEKLDKNKEFDFSKFPSINLR